MDLNINWTFEDFEIRKTNRIVGGQPYWELVKWQTHNGQRSCFTLAFFDETSEGWELRFVGNRPFEYIDNDKVVIVWKALCMVNKTLNEYFKISYELKNL
jgi:hypothetical protein